VDCLVVINSNYKCVNPVFASDYKPHPH
jgi:hypothetical protein